jgi:hypothetical protein
MRLLGAAAALLGAVWGPFSATLSGILAATAGYLLLSAIVGSCFGYRLMGKSTCKAQQVT